MSKERHDVVLWSRFAYLNTDNFPAAPFSGKRLRLQHRGGAKSRRRGGNGIIKSGAVEFLFIVV